MWKVGRNCLKMLVRKRITLKRDSVTKRRDFKTLRRRKGFERQNLKVGILITKFKDKRRVTFGIDFNEGRWDSKFDEK